MPIRVACQTYTWEMLGNEWQGSVDDLLDAIAAAGYEGIEITSNMIAEYAERPADYVVAATSRGVTPAAFAYARPSGFTDPDTLAEDLEGARLAADFAAHFPSPILGFGGAAHASRDDVHAKLDQALRFYNEAGRIAAAAGAHACVHPHSHFGSLLESAEEYEYLLDRLDPSCVNFCPDTGHIVRGGQDLLTCLQAHAHRIIHFHLKDAAADRTWVALGDGICDFPKVLALLEAADYSGWIVAEEESTDARADGIAAINKNRAYLRSIGY